MRHLHEIDNGYLYFAEISLAIGQLEELAITNTPELDELRPRLLEAAAHQQAAFESPSKLLNHSQYKMNHKLKEVNVDLFVLFL